MTVRLPPATPVRAAGTVLWRRGHDGLQVALVHRPRYDDWSLPKGKADPGEHPVVTAVRETAEEAGFTGPLARHLGVVAYDVPGPDGSPVPKTVDYWSMRAERGGFTPNAEVDVLRWVSPEEAQATVTREADRRPLGQLVATPLPTATVLLIRHAQAGDKSRWVGADDERQLDAEGREQATAIAAVAACFGVHTVVSADVTRCRQTVEPLASALGVGVAADPAFGVRSHARHPQRALRALRRHMRTSSATAICSQGEVIPDLLAGLGHGSRLRIEPRARKGSLWVLTFAEEELVDATYLESALPPTT